MNLVIVTDKDFIDSNKLEIFDERYLHIKNILKKNINETVEIGIINKEITTAKIQNYNQNSICLEVIKKDTIIDRTIIELDIICALPRPQTIKKILPLIATAGVRNLHFIRSNRVEKSFYNSPLVQSKEKINKYLIDGLSQGKRIKLPEVKIFDRFQKYFDDEFVKIKEKSPDKTSYLIAHPGTDINLYDVAKDHKIEKLTVAVGPEGGWIPHELNYMEELGFQKVNLGPSIFRVENAINAIIGQKELIEMIL